MLRFLFIFSVMVSLVNCKTSEDVADENQPLPTYEQEFSLDKYPKIKKERNIDTLVAVIAEDNIVYGKGVGLAAQYPIQYAAYERIGQIARKKQLFKLLEHDSAAVRVYAYKALNDRSEELGNEAREILKYDSTDVEEFVGCLGGKWPVYYMVQPSPEFSDTIIWQGDTIILKN